jgi:putative ABC transport system permease protein
VIPCSLLAGPSGPVGPVEIGAFDLALGAVLVLGNAALSVALQLGVAWRLLWSTTRMVVQLLLVGHALRLLFAAAHPGWTALAAALMVAFAGYEILGRQERRLRGLWAYGLGTGAMFVSSVLVTLFALHVQLDTEPWFDPRYSIPLLGMILGNAMTGISLGINTLTTTLVDRRGAVEAQLALGATRWQAVRQPVRRALRTALIPLVNRMAATGVVFLPGMMTGQILAGADPTTATHYQILISFLIAGGTALGAAVAVLGGVRRLTDDRHRLRLDRLTGDQP